jgi:hypothetical protein
LMKCSGFDLWLAHLRICVDHPNVSAT